MLIGAFNQEKALVGAFSVLDYEPLDGPFSSSSHHRPYLVDGEGGRVDVGQPPDIVPGLLPVLLLHTAVCEKSSTHCHLIFVGTLM